MKKAFTAALASLAIGLTASAEDLATELQRVMDGLSDPNPVVRIVTLDQAMASSRPIVRQKALELSLKSSDFDLRLVALESVFKTKKTFNIQLSPNGKSRDLIMENTKGFLNLQISGFDPKSGDFMAYSTESTVRNVANERVIEVRQGNLSGDRISFDLNYDPLNLSSEACSAVAQLSGDTGTLVGQFKCDELENPMTIDLLR
jgi:hypothetical protein